MATLFRVTTPSGRPRLMSEAGQDTTALCGFLRHLLSLVNTAPLPTHLIVVFDGRGETKRHRLYPEYKSGRRGGFGEEDVGMVQEVLDALGIKWVCMDETEADNVIGTLAHRFAKDNVICYICSTDKDFFQLLTDRIVFIRGPLKGRYAHYSTSTFQKEFGISPDQWIELVALQGDAADNIPNLPKIGTKNATELISKHGYVKEVFEHAAEVKRKSIRETLSAPDAFEVAMRNRELARIDVNLKSKNLKMSLEKTRLRRPADEGVRFGEIMDSYDIKALKAEWNAALRTFPATKKRVSKTKKLTKDEIEKSLAAATKRHSDRHH